MGKLDDLKKLNKDPFTKSDADSVNVSARMLSYLCTKKKIYRLGHGYYSLKEVDDFDLASIVREIINQIEGDCVICLQTALQLYDLTDESPPFVDVFVSWSNAPKRKLENAKLHKTRYPLSQLQTNSMNGIKVTSIEQTIVDLLRFGFPVAQAIDVHIRASSKGIIVKIDVLKKIAEEFRAKAKIKQFIEAIL